jgi:hypothetical protein
MLVRRDNEWVCGAPANDIRAFWPRVVAWHFGAALAAYLLVTLVVFGGLKATKAFEVSWGQVAWPGNWEQIPKNRADAFFGRAIQAFAGGRGSEAMVALGTARGLDGTDYDTRLLQAQIAMFQFNTAYADQEFRALGREFPDRGERTALIYHDTLLALFRYEPLALLCLDMALADPGRAALWVKSLLHALRDGGGAAVFVARHEAAIHKLPAHARLLLAAEAAVQSGEREKARAQLAQPFEGPLNPVYFDEQLMALARLGEADTARSLLRRMGPAFGDSDFMLGELALDYFTPDRSDEQLDLRSLLGAPLRAVQVHRLLALLIMRGDRDGFVVVETWMRQRPELAADVSGAAMWITALAFGRADLGAHWKTAGRQQFGDGYPSITAIDFSARSLERTDGVPSLVNALTLPREVIFALQSRTEKTPATKPASR